MASVTSNGDLIGRLYSQFSSQALQGYGISKRERDVLQLMADGKGDKEIAFSLAVSRFTINKHVCAILRKIGAASRTEAAVRAVRMGLIV
jgi:DNA-binding NarL/FixJ family response regulator